MNEARCASCELDEGRRAFLRTTMFAVASALVAVGASSATAFAAPLEIVSGRRRGGQGVRYPIPASDGARIDKDNQVIIVRWQNTAYAFNLSCPHQNTALRWDDADHRFQCPKHHSKYRPDGEFIEGRATRGMDRLAIQREGNDLVVDVDKMFKEDEEKAAWAAACVVLST